ncbi:hypothetical protein Aab01nite_57330 [Paractinoplanes abujensis]|uniref:DUF4192 domain-containing protein n=1 Tax=Paractinoplanes abujensis TaxID=882441 RepID=A0A7W7CWY5_9ACTN|nr:DUF4192 domain-containing protein [Actinoplanes abujensis]MBB4696152.1 hypothetical protein [Actinoplanes abujensis]GID22143.1 hypothetical protein Aab01nite_57330 [Actinoplanes abujensis]
MQPDCRITVRNSADLIAVTPYLLGFHPSDSVVVIGTVGPVVSFAARHDFLAPDDEDADVIAPLVAAQEVEAVTLLGFGPPGPVDRTVRAFFRDLQHHGVRVLDRVRVTAGRWWSYDCADPLCCPPDGNPVPSPHSPIAASAVFQGHVALPDRRALVEQIAGVEGEQRERMRALTAELCARGSGPPEGIERAGRYLVQMAEERYSSGRTLTLEETALLGVLLADPVVFDHAVDRTRDEDWRVALWTEVTRRVEPVWVAPAAALLAYSAWRAGLGSLARVALDRALLHDPTHRFSWALDRLMAAGVSHELVDDLHETVREWPEGSL